jgi:hypothetical protein
MRPSEQPPPLPIRLEPRPELTGPGRGSGKVAGPPAEGDREPAARWEGYDLLVLDALL